MTQKLFKDENEWKLEKVALVKNPKQRYYG